MLRQIFFKKIVSIQIIIIMMVAIGLGVGCEDKAQEEFGINKDKKLVKVILAQNPVPHSTLTIVAKKKGFFKEQGLDVQVKEFTTGKLCFDAMLGGGANFSTVADTPIVYAGFSNQPVYLIATIESSPLSVKILARKDKGVEVPADLKGKMLGTFKGGSAEYFLAKFLIKNGMTMDDSKIVYMRPPELVAAIIRGDLAAISMWEPHIYNAKKAIGENTITFTGEDIYTETFNIAVMKEFAENNGKTVDKFLKALSKAENFVKQHENETKQILIDSISIDQEVLDNIWPNFRFDLVLEQSLIDQLSNGAKYAIESGAVPPDSKIPNYNDMFEPRFLHHIEQHVDIKN